jgi:hypothetical protein
VVFSQLTHRRLAYAGPTKAPSGLTANGVAGSAVLSWWGSAGVSAYQVRRSSAAGGPYAVLATVKAGELLTFTDAPPQGTLFYRISAAPADGSTNTVWSTAVRFVAPGELRFSMGLDDGSGSQAVGWATDSDGRKTQVQGTLMQGAAWGDGRVSGKAVAFDGKSFYVQLPAGLLKGLADFTVSMWVYVQSLHWDTFLLFVGQDGLAYMRLVPQAGNFKFAITAATYKDERSVEGSSALPVGRWVHVAVTLQGTTGSLCVDGKLAASHDGIALSPHQLGDQLRMLGWDGSHPAFSGRMQDFRLYTQALPPAAIESLAK